MENPNAKKMVRRTDPDTSVDAAILLDPTKLEKIVLDKVAECGEEGATMSEIEIMLKGLHPSSITPRFRPLIEKGHIIVDDRTRKGLRSNRQQRIHWTKENYNQGDKNDV